MKLAPGISFCLFATAVILWIRPLLPDYFGDASLAVAIGLAIGNALRLPDAVRPGAAWLSRSGLRLAIFLLGARLAFEHVLRGGAASLVLLLATMSIAALVVRFAGQRAGLPASLTTLVAVGTAICGNSAILATAPLIEADRREVAFAVATITLFGTIAVFVFPIVGHVLALPPAVYGVWAGAAVNDTSQVLAAGTAYGATAASVATVVKLTRNALMAPVLVGIGLFQARRAAGVSASDAIRKSVPTFVLGFLAVAALNSMGALPAPLRQVMLDVSRWLIVAALFGIGLTTRFSDLRDVGTKPFLVGLVASLGLATLALLIVLATAAQWLAVFGQF
ncbi:MAG: putative sulfate exporter family transporter [Armatimonadetes bacterium]|nr:putative sulfate exporter family transporter [Armatimonadota bacterium]